MFSDDYAPGTRVEFKITGVVDGERENITARNESYGISEVRVVADDGTIHYVYLHDENTKVISPPDPEDWKPEVGDIWEAGGHEYFVYTAIFGGTTVFPFEGSETLEFYSDDDLGNSLEKFKALNPTLVRRRNKDSISDGVNLTVNYTATPPADIASAIFDNIKRYGGRTYGGRIA